MFTSFHIKSLPEETHHIIFLKKPWEDEWAEIEETCASMNITVEQFALALANFCAEPGAKEALNQWYAALQSE